MSAPKVYLRCACPKCAGHIDYPDYTAGGVMRCPQCGNQVRLPAAAVNAGPPPVAPTPHPKPPTVPPPRPATAPSPPKLAPAAPQKRTFRRMLAVTAAVVAGTMVLLVLLVVVAGIAKHRGNSAAPESPPVQEAPKAAPEAPKSIPPSPPSPPSNPPTPVAKSKSPKSITDLKVGETVSVEEPKGAKGSRLVYATGTVRNDSDLQRFGVRVELDLLDAAGAKVGTATDYTASIEARASWRFRALVVERRAMSAKLARITEDN